jgi:biopolymer transport protein ExbD
MRFIEHRRRQPPPIIIISLIDILIVLLIFLMLTTTFKQHPAIKLALPEAKQGQEGASEQNLIVTVAKQAPHFYLGDAPVALDRLQAELMSRAAKAPLTTLLIRADTDAPFGKIVNVMDAARAARIKAVSAFVKNLAKP